MSNQIVRNLLKPVRSCIFSVMCDEYTDVSNKGQLIFCMSWVNNDLEVSEKFLGFYEIPDIKSSTIVTVVKDILLRYQLNLICAEVNVMAVLAICWENHPVLPLRFLQNNQGLLPILPCSFSYHFRSKVSLKILRFSKTPWD